MPHQVPHFAVPGSVAIGNDLVDCQPLMAGPNVFGIWWLITNQYDQRCIKHLENLVEFRGCQYVLATALNSGTASVAQGAERRYTYDNLDPAIRYEFVYAVGPVAGFPGPLAFCWAIHKYLEGKQKTGAASSALHVAKMAERFQASGLSKHSGTTAASVPSSASAKA